MTHDAALTNARLAVLERLVEAHLTDGRTGWRTFDDPAMRETADELEVDDLVESDHWTFRERGNGAAYRLTADGIRAFFADAFARERGGS